MVGLWCRVWLGGLGWFVACVVAVVVSWLLVLLVGCRSVRVVEIGLVVVAGEGGRGGETAGAAGG